MGFHRRILDIYSVTGSDCYYGCREACNGGGCSPSPPPTVTAFPAATAAAGPQRRHLTNLVIASGCLVAAAFFLVLIYHAVLTHRRKRRSPIVLPPGSDDDGDTFSERGDGVHHPEWRVQADGLDEATIASIAVVEYRAAGEKLLGGGGDCSVCLGEFQDCELVRLLPNCGHAFHVPCIDTWLSAHVNCPLCRAHIVAPPDSAAATAVDHSPEGNSDYSGALEGVLAARTDIGLSEGEGEEGEMEAGMEVLLDPSTPVESYLDEGDAFRVRRSVSMSSLPPCASLPAIDPGERSHEKGKESSFQEEHSSKNREKQGNASKVEKCLSSSGRGFFFSKNERSRGVVLPL